MKYLFIAALLSLLFLLVYSRLRPYIQGLQKVYRILKTDSATDESPGRASVKGQNRLIRCVSCGTWVPAGRAIGLNSGASVYCSRDCLEKGPSLKERKLAG